MRNITTRKIKLYTYVLQDAWPPKEFGVSSIGDNSKDDSPAVADDNTQVHWIGLHDCRRGDACLLHQGVERR